MVVPGGLVGCPCDHPQLLGVRGFHGGDATLRGLEFGRERPPFVTEFDLALIGVKMALIGVKMALIGVKTALKLQRYTRIHM